MNQTTSRRIGILSSGLVLLVAACGDDDNAPVGPGERCDERTCQSELVCEPDVEGVDICQRPLGSDCDLDDPAPFCLVPSECVALPEPGEGEGTGDSNLGFCAIPDGGTCDPLAEDPYCAPGLVCAEHVDGSYRCRAPVFIEGDVFDAQSLDAIEGALIVALNEELVAVTDVATSGEDGDYRLALPAVRVVEDGAPASNSFTLRASAADYQTFPGGVRRALPINVSEAVLTDDDEWIIDNALTRIALIMLHEAERGGFRVSGAVLANDDDDDRIGGVLVVIEGGGGAWSGVSDRNGAYTVFNVPDGSHEVRGYTAGLQWVPVDITVSDEDLEGIDLVESDDEPVDVMGSVNIVETSGETSVVLVVESTFDLNLERGEVPPGLRAPPVGPPDVTGGFTIAGVPEGTYVVLAAFENDDLVRDPDQNISGTDFVTVEVPASGDAVTIGDPFKVNKALPIFGPGADRPEEVSSRPTLTWGDDSSEEWYEVEVLDAFGEVVWAPDHIDGVSGSDRVTTEYGGPMEPGMFYQFRVTSWRQPGGGQASPISRTEDLRGVFHVAPE